MDPGGSGGARATRSPLQFIALLEHNHSSAIGLHVQYVKQL